MANSVDLVRLPVPLQDVPDPGYNAIDLRRFGGAVLGQEGVVAGTDFDVSQDTGANRFIRVQPGEAFVQGDSTTGQGRYYARLDAVEAGVDIAAGDASNPRIDQVVLEIKDDVHDASGLNKGRIRVVAGTPTGGADLSNRLGAAALPPSCLRLADVLMPTGAVAVTNVNIRDRRPWARGAFRRILRNSNAGGTNNYTTTSGTLVALDATNLIPRLELGGSPVRVSWWSKAQHSNGSGRAAIAVALDGTATVDASQPGVAHVFVPSIITANNLSSVSFSYVLQPSAGSHTFSPLVQAIEAGTFTIPASASEPVEWVIEELVRQNADNL